MFKYFTTMSTKNKISLILLLQLLLATPLFANSYGLDTVAKVETERCIVRFNVSPADVQATVMYKSALPDAVEIQLGTVNENGSVASFVELGEYDYKVVAQGYITAEGRLVLNKAGGVVVENVALRSKLANITLKAKGNDIYVNGEKVGTDEWSATLQAGSYTVECRKKNCRSSVQVIEVAEGCDEIIQLSPAVPIVGGLLLLSNPLDARVVIDGIDCGLSPLSVSNLFVGNYKVEVSKVGYISREFDVVIEENVTNEQEVQLVKATCADAALAYDNGEYSRAVEILTGLVEVNDVEALFLMGLCHYNGNGVAPSKETAVELWHKAADLGLDKAQYALGLCYYMGDGTQQSCEAAAEWYRKAAEQGVVKAQYALGGCYYNGEGVEQSYEYAVKWYSKAAEQGNAMAQYNLGRCYYNGTGVQQSCETAVELWRKAAEQGHTKAQYILGYCLYNGTGVQQSYEAAVEWFRKSAEQGEAAAQYNLGQCYYSGSGVQQSYEAAVEWYRKSAEQGHPDAQYNLGGCYYDGLGVQQSYETAVEWFRKAAEQGDVEAQYNLGQCYCNGVGIKKSYESAVKWWSKSAEQGYAMAQNNLGTCYYNGWGVQQSYDAAVEWFSKSAEQGHAMAQYNLGQCYYRGEGVQQSYELAVELYRKAAEQGIGNAWYCLGNCYENALGVPKALDEALVFYRKAVELGCDADKDVERVRNLLDTQRIYDVVEVNPEFPGGTDGIARYLLDNVKYPQKSSGKKSQGRAFVQFVVNSDGSIQDVEIIRSSGDVDLDKEAIRVVEAMPKWKPGKQNGKAVRVKLSLMVNFRIRS